MRVVIALGGNALLKRGEPMTAERQRGNIRSAAPAQPEWPASTNWSCPMAMDHK